MDTSIPQLVYNIPWLRDTSIPQLVYMYNIPWLMDTSIVVQCTIYIPS